jgi:uncharacterized protein YbjT (DUF2867 family)
MYVVLGASGNTGRVIAKTLLGKGHKVRAVSRNPEHLQFLTAKGAEAFPGDLTDLERLTRAFAGGNAAYVLIPPVINSNDYRALQDRMGGIISTALKSAGIKHVVSLSSIGAEQPAGNGPVAGLHDLEQKLNQIEGLNVLHLRAGYFMENTLSQVSAIRGLGTTAGPLKPDLKLPMIATDDIGHVAAEELLRLDFRGKQTRELQGAGDLSYTDVARVIGKAINKSDLGYVQASDDQVRASLLQMGMSLNFAKLILEMAGALNSGQMRALETRSSRNTTPTTYEAFVEQQFLPLYQQQAAA